MIKQWIRVLALAALLTTPAYAQQAFVEGTDYELIAEPVKTIDASKVVVSEMFWYGCPHCFRFEPYVEKWSANLPQGVIFEQVPSILNPRWSDHARTYYTLRLMGELDKKGSSIHSKIFDEIHISRKRLDSLDAIAAFIGSQGIDETKFRQTYASFQVDALLRKNLKKEQKYGHQGVPAVIVNGKYKTSGSMAGSNARLIEVVNFLVAKERAL